MTNPVDREAALVLSRFGLGARADSFAAISADPRGALQGEVSKRTLAQPTGPALKASPALLLEAFDFQKDRKAERDRQSAMAKGTQAAGMQAAGSQPSGMAAPVNPAQQVFLGEVDARFNGTMRDPVIGFGERLAMFWANHFAVAVGKGEEVRITAGAFEREAIRPYVFGRFEEMLLAVETHPAMLVFLDNRQSVGPHSRASGHGKRGLNENLAREIMELHTLGVDGGYTQRDVTSFASVITGWTVARPGSKFGAPGSFAFNENAHEPGVQTVLGVSYRDDGIEQGRAVLRDLAQRPATAHHVAFKLARYFVADQPPSQLVAALAATFTRTRGDLAAVYQTLLASEQAWNPDLVKIRSPQEYLVAMLRASDERPKPGLIVGALNAMGQPLWNPRGPNGFADTVDAWASSEGLATRIDVANLIASTTPGQGLARVDPRRFAAATLGSLLSPDTDHAIQRAETKVQGVSIAFLSPEFQRR